MNQPHINGDEQISNRILKIYELIKKVYCLVSTIKRKGSQLRAFTL